MEPITLSEADLQKVHEAAKFIEAHYKRHFTIPELSAKVTLNVKKLKQGFKDLYGMGTYEYLLHYRMEKARELLLTGETVMAVAIATGFKGATATTNFIRSFKRIYQLSPAAWARQQKGDDNKTK
jgi:AraC-like DNA-binding protein